VHRSVFVYAETARIKAEHKAANPDFFARIAGSANSDNMDSGERDGAEFSGGRGYLS